MAEKAIRLGGEATADAIVSAVDTMYSEHTFNEKDFVLKHNDAEIAMDSNFAAQSFWKDVRVRFFRKNERGARPDPRCLYRAAGGIWPLA